MIHQLKHNNKINLLNYMNYNKKLNNYKNIKKYVIQINIKNNKINILHKKHNLIMILINLNYN